MSGHRVPPGVTLSTMPAAIEACSWWCSERKADRDAPFGDYGSPEPTDERAPAPTLHRGLFRPTRD